VVAAGTASALLTGKMSHAMSYRYVIYKELRLVISMGKGVVTLNEIRTEQDRLLSDPDFDPSFNQLVDAITVTKLDVSVDEAKELVRRRIVSSTSRRALWRKGRPFLGWGV